MGGGFGVSTSFVTALGIDVKRDGVRIVAPHDLQEHDEHKIWTKKNTWHWETGWVWHLTQGQVLHVDANLVETHINMSPIQVHMNQGMLPVNLKVHWEPNLLTRTVHFHAGRYGSHFNELEQEAGEIELHAVRRDLGVVTNPVLSKIAAGLQSMAGIKPTPGTLTLKADGEMTLDSKTSITLLSANLRGMLKFDDEGNAELTVTEKLDLISRKTVLKAGNSEVTLKTGEIKLESGAASVSLSNGILTTNGTETKLNGKVTLGHPAASSIATKPVVTPVRRLDPARVDLLRQQIAAARARLPLPPAS